MDLLLPHKSQPHRRLQHHHRRMISGLHPLSVICSLFLAIATHILSRSYSQTLPLHLRFAPSEEEDAVEAADLSEILNPQRHNSCSLRFHSSVAVHCKQHDTAFWFDFIADRSRFSSTLLRLIP